MSSQLLKTAVPVLTRGIHQFGALSAVPSSCGCNRQFSTSNAASASPAAEFVVSKVDALVNWAREGSMWPMTFGLGKYEMSSITTRSSMAKSGAGKYLHTVFSFWIGRGFLFAGFIGMAVIVMYGS